MRWSAAVVTSRSVTSLIVLSALALSPSARAQLPFEILEPFTSPTGWIGLTTPSAGVGNSFLSSGGNPGGYLRSQLRPDPSLVVAAGAAYSGRWFLFGTTNVQIEFQIDVRLGSTSAIPTSALQLTAVLLQNGRMFRPRDAAPVTLSSTWTTLSLMSYDLSMFTTSSGLAFDVNTWAQVGFVSSLAPDPTSSPTVVVETDNAFIRIIPAPGGMGAMALAMLLAARRRR